MFSVYVADGKSEVALVFPFRGISSVRVEGKVRGATVDEIGLKIGDFETRTPGTVTLDEEDGTFRVIAVSVELPPVSQELAVKASAASPRTP